MLLAEKGGVCVIFGTMCCTCIPNYTAPDGSVTKALAENSGVDNSLTNWVDSMFGKWKNVMIAVLWATFTCVTVSFVRMLRERSHFQDSGEIDDATDDEIRTDSKL
jgi:hypothetical protein